MNLVKKPYMLKQYVGLFFDSFWRRSPALFYGLFLYLAAVAAVSWHIALLLPIFCLMIYSSQVQKERLLLGLVGFALFWLYAASHTVYPPVWADSVTGAATFEITDWVNDIRYGRPYCKMQVYVHSFEADNGSYFAKNIPCRLVWGHPATRPSADALYGAKAVLQEHNGSWTLKLDKDVALQKRGEVYSLAEWRHKAKSAVKVAFAKYLAPTQTRAFLEGVLLGEFHDTMLASSLKRFGLQHITVVSGFHFSLIAVLLAGLFRLVLPWRLTNICLLAAILGYLLFIGPSPSVLRAWVAITTVFLGKLFERSSNGMNALGLGLILVLCIDPTSALKLGFQLSFLATFAILLFFPLVEQTIRGLFPERRAQEVLQMTFSEQLFFVLLRFFITSLALVISVSILVVPVSLYYFEQFPLMGIVYNCFFPFLVSIAIFIVCFAFLFFWIPPVAHFLFSIASFILDTALTLINHAPSWCDTILHVTCISSLWLVGYLCAIVFLGVIRTESTSRSGS